MRVENIWYNVGAGCPSGRVPPVGPPMASWTAVLILLSKSCSKSLCLWSMVATIRDLIFVSNCLLKASSFSSIRRETLLDGVIFALVVAVLPAAAAYEGADEVPVLMGMECVSVAGWEANCSR